MRVLLFTGKGGAGKTTTAAATATLAAARGLKTLVISTDAAHSLADAFAAPIGAEPAELDAGLYGLQVDAQGGFERSWREVQGYLLTLLESGGVDVLEAEELTVLPGAEEVLALIEVRGQVLSGRWDLVVVDCAPAAETLRLLALPDVLTWYADRLFPVERRVVRSLRPVLSRVAGLPVPDDALFEAVARLREELAGVRRVLTDPELTSVRLVLTPEAVVVAEARRTLTSLSLYGYRVDGVVANRVFPPGGDDPWRAGWVAAQRAQLAAVDDSFAGLTVHRAPYRASEPVGRDQLAELAAQMYGADDPFAVRPTDDPVAVTRADSGGYLMEIALPLADRSDVDLVRRGDEIVVTVAGHRRVLALPSALRRCVVTGAQLRAGRLRVDFAPDPALWMST
ncbi:MAG TPA: ArsA family ATPase [Mycobacteriales bacterium]|nr:ArsA family ATPase [Mycobacteriales bacterium]